MRMLSTAPHPFARTMSRIVLVTLPSALMYGRRIASSPFWKRMSVGSCHEVDEIAMLCSAASSECLYASTFANCSVSDPNLRANKDHHVLVNLPDDIHMRCL